MPNSFESYSPDDHLKRPEANKKPVFRDHLLRIPSLDQQKRQTGKLLESLPAVSEKLQELLSPDEFETLAIDVKRGDTLYSDPPINTASIALSFSRSGRRVGIEDYFSWKGRSEPVRFKAKVDRGRVDDSLHVPLPLLKKSLERLMKRIRRGDLEEKPKTWNDRLDQLLDSL